MKSGRSIEVKKSEIVDKFGRIGKFYILSRTNQKILRTYDRIPSHFMEHWEYITEIIPISLDLVGFRIPPYSSYILNMKTREFTSFDIDFLRHPKYTYPVQIKHLENILQTTILSVIFPVEILQLIASYG